MSRFVNRGVVRVVALAVVVMLVVVWHEVSSETGPRAPVDTAATEPPAAQVVVPATTLVPAVTPPPSPAPAKVHRKRLAHHAHHRHRAHRHHQRRGARRAARGHHARHHHARHHHALHHHARHHAKHEARHHPRHHPVQHLPPGAGGDIGWPQCPPSTGNHGRHGLGQPMPDAGARFVIVGLTNGRAFTPSPCLAQHLRWVRSHHVYASAYAFATYPTRKQLRQYRHLGPYDGRSFLGALGNTGHAAARYNIRLMRQHGFTTPHVWLDVEPSSSRPWSHRHRWNAAVVQGWVRAYREAGYSVGFYSTTNLWHEIVGRLTLHLPEWRTAGPVSPRGALGRCGDGSFQGGPAVVSQWWTTHRDFDRICPSASRTSTLTRYFHKW